MVEKFLEQTTFTSQEDFIKNLKIKIPENFNFGYDIVDAGLPKNPIRKHCYGLMIKGSIYNILMQT